MNPSRRPVALLAALALLAIGAAPAPADEPPRGGTLAPVLDPLAALGRVAPGDGNTPVSAWISGQGQFGTIGARGTTPGATYSSGGTLLGADYRLAPGLVVGGYAGYTGTSGNIRALNATARTDTAQLGVYAGARFGATYVGGTVGYAHSDAVTRRVITLSPLLPSLVARSNPALDHIFLALEAGHVLRLGEVTMLAPFAGLIATITEQDRVSESGAGRFNLTVPSDTVSSVRMQLGARLSHAVEVGLPSPLTLSLKLGWEHEIDSDPSQVTAQISAPSFVTDSLSVRGDRALVGAGLAGRLSASLSYFLRYEGAVNESDTAHGVRGGLRLAW